LFRQFSRSHVITIASPYRIRGITGLIAATRQAARRFAGISTTRHMVGTNLVTALTFGMEIARVLTTAASGAAA
jgi:hypothetical protein